MRPAGDRRIVTHAVMAFGEDGDAVDAGTFEGRRERVRIEFLADIGNERRGVEVEVNLAESGLHVGLAEPERAVFFRVLALGDTSKEAESAAAKFAGVGVGEG